jgi:hypothetical protein
LYLYLDVRSLSKIFDRSEGSSLWLGDESESSCTSRTPIENTRLLSGSLHSLLSIGRPDSRQSNDHLELSSLQQVDAYGTSDGVQRVIPELAKESGDDFNRLLLDFVAKATGFLQLA